MYIETFFITNVVYEGIRIGNEKWSIYYCISLMYEANFNKNVLPQFSMLIFCLFLQKNTPPSDYMFLYIFYYISNLNSRHAIIRFNCRYVQQKFFLTNSMILQTKDSIQSLKSVIWKENILDLYIWHLCNSLCTTNVCHGNSKQIYSLPQANLVSSFHGFKY